MTEEISQVLGKAQKKAGWYRTLRNLALLLVLALVAFAVSNRLRSIGAAYTYTTAAAERGDLTVLVTTTGALQPLNRVEVGTEVSGTIESVTVDFNEEVGAGQILAQLDTDQLEAQFRQSRAALALAEAKVIEAQATLTETEKRLRRTQDLVARRLSSDEDLDTSAAAFARAEAGLTVAEAQVDQAQAQLDADRRTLEKAVIRSPIDGIVLERRVEPGQTVAAALQTPVLFTLADDLQRMELRVDVDEADVGQVAAGQPAVFSVDAYPERSFPAQIKQVRFAPKEVNGVVTYETLLAVDNPDLLLRPGMTATAEITVEKFENVVLVPNATLRFRPPAMETKAARVGSGGLLEMLIPRPPAEERSAVRIVDPDEARVWVLRDGEPAPVAVETGATDGTMTHVVAGDLEPGTPLVVEAVRKGG